MTTTRDRQSLCDEFEENGFIIEALYANAAGKSVTYD
jgi:hypothetical protein